MKLPLFFLRTSLEEVVSVPIGGSLFVSGGNRSESSYNKYDSNKRITADPLKIILSVVENLLNTLIH